MMSSLRIIDWSSLSAKERSAALARPPASLDPALIERVRRILAAVRDEGDAAVRRFTAEFDGVDVATTRVDPQEAGAAWQALGSAEQEALTHARDNIRRFHAAQPPRECTVVVEQGVTCRQIVRPISSVGLYVPGGTAPLPSAVLMLAVPAAIAGCERRVLCSPPTANGRPATAVLAAAWLCGVTEIHAVGGAQAIAAMAMGTDCMPRVDKLFGPGNAYVTAAKMLAAQDAGGAACDLPAGPSEVLVIADDGADAEALAADLIAQAEHGTDSQALLFTDSASQATRVRDAVAEQAKSRRRREILDAALANSACIVFNSVERALEVSNEYAPEHLILNVANAAERVDEVQSAGSVFVGPWSAETFGDYCSGTNHVLPTYGFARAYSGVSVASFEKTITVQELSGEGFDRLAETAITLANMEGLDGHANAVSVRQTRRRARGAA